MSSEKKRIIAIAIDGSDYSNHAVEWYDNKLRKDGDHAVFVYVTESPSLPVFTFKSGINVPHEEWAKIMEKQNESVQKIENDTTDYIGRILKKDKTFKHEIIHVCDSLPGPGIVHKAKEKNAELIVMGTRGMNGLRRTFLGSVSDYVLHHTEIPVAVVPPVKPEEQ